MEKPMKLPEGKKLTRNDLTAYIKGKHDKTFGSAQRLLLSSFADFMRGKDYDETIVIDLGTFNRRFYPRSIQVDIFEEDTDIIADITKSLPFESNSVDFVACTAVLEHVSEPQFVVNEIYRILRPGGAVWVDIPFMQPYHASPDDYQRYTLTGIKHLFKAFEMIESGAGYPNGFAIKWILEKFRDTSFANGDLPNPAYETINTLFSEGFFQKLSTELSEMDVNLVNKYGRKFPDNMHEVGNALYYYGKKNPEEGT